MKSKIITEYQIFRKEVTWVEYALWWVARAAICYALIKTIQNERAESLVLQICSKFAFTFPLSFVHLLPRKFFFARLSYKIQDIIIFLLTASAFGQYAGFYNNVEWYDFFIHIIDCFLCVFVGYELAMAMKHDKEPLPPVVAAICGFGLSFFFAVCWEIFEFSSDTIFVGSNSQNWMVINSEQLLEFFPNDIDPRRLPLLDTMTDLIGGAAGSLLGAFSLNIYLHFKKRWTRHSDQIKHKGIPGIDKSRNG